MASEEYLKQEGVDKLGKTPAGRAYLDKLRKQNEIDLLQPSDPRFEKVYGERNRKQEERSRKQKEMCAGERKDFEERQNYDKMRHKEPGYRMFY